MYKKHIKIVILLIGFFCLSEIAYTQSNNDSAIAQLLTAQDDSVKVKDDKPNFIEDEVDYKAKDSIILSNDHSKVFLYKDATVDYGDISLKADYIVYDQEKNEVFARGVIDSLGEVKGKPVFREGNDEFEAKTIRYNFDTKRAYVEDVFTEEQEGYLHSKFTKKFEDNSFNLKGGKYTTCDSHDPHYYLAITKGKAIPNDKIISGYSYLVIADIPLYVIGIPWGFFPNKQEQSSGILIPRYGEERNRGFFLKDGGYYFGINENMDLSITGDIYSKGTWGASAQFRYRKRYKYTSNFNFRYYENVTGDKGTSSYSKRVDYAFIWSHSQDSKANPTRRFSASVNMSSSKFDRLNTENINSKINNTKSSNITYAKNWPGTPFRFSANLRHSQNTRTNDVNLTLPVLTFNMSRIYPFRSKTQSGKTRWYENIELSYQSKFENRLKTKDELLFTDTEWEDFNYGFQHTIPLRTNLKVFKDFNISPSVEYTGILYPSYIKYSDPVLVYDPVEDENVYENQLDTINELSYAQLINPSISASYNPKVFFTYQYKSETFKIEAIRHVLSPTVRFSYRPDMGSMVDKYYSSYLRAVDSVYQQYSQFENGLYRLPMAPGEYGVINLSLQNNIEMKVRTFTDTAVNVEKVKLLDNLSITTYYDLFKDSLNWAPLAFVGRTSLFDNVVRIGFNGQFSPYALDDNGRTLNKYVWEESDNWLRFTKFQASIDFNLQSKRKKKDDDKSGNTGGQSPQGYNVGNEFAGLDDQDLAMGIPPPLVGNEYVDFDIPWSLTVGYQFIYSKPLEESNIIQTLNFSGNVNLTDKWKISFQSYYDFSDGKLGTTSINIHRNLHCWEMSFRWIPVGQFKSYSFRINVKSSVLRDLQYEKKRNWRDMR